MGANWTAISDGGLSITSQAAAGSSSSIAGDIRTGETYASDQYSQLEVSATQLSGGQWIGPAVRSQNGGQDTYLGIYFWNSGSPELRLYKRSAGSWTQLGSSYSSGPLAAGTQLKLMAVGSTISFLQDGVERIAVTDNSLTGGAPGIISFGAATADNWAGNPTPSSTDANGGGGAGGDPSVSSASASVSSSAFCYGVDPDSYEWITPTSFTYLTTAPQPELNGNPYWSYGAMPFAIEGTDPTGVMGNGYRPYCGKGTPTGIVVDNQGENVPYAYASLLADNGATVTNPNQDPGVPGWYQVVTP